MRVAVAVFATVVLVPVLHLVWNRTRADALARSDGSPAGLTAAARLDPGNDVYWILLAQRREERGEKALPDWLRAVELNPRRDLSLTQAAISAEFAGDVALAERLLLQAERYNRLWLPRWSLASFHARHDNPQQLAHWARLALERAYGDRTPLFRLCREAGAPAAFMLKEIVPADAASLSAYLDYTVAEGSVDDIEPAAARLLDVRSREHVRAASTAVAALIGAGRPRAALRIWNRIAGARLIPYPLWQAEVPLANPRLLAPLAPPAFDWRIPTVAGVESRRGVPEGGIKFTLSGQQAEAVELLAQTLFLAHGGEWTLEFEYQTRGVSAAQSGLDWELEPLGAGPALEPSDDWTPARAIWHAPPGEGLYRLSFGVRRPIGQTRIEGEVWLRGLSLRAGGLRP